LENHFKRIGSQSTRPLPWLLLRLILYVCINTLLPVPVGHAQSLGATTGSSSKLAFLIPNLLNQSLQSVSDPGLRLILQQALNPNFGSVNSGVAAELSSLPVPSPASAIRYTFNRELGVYVAIPQSFGPILTERAETIGKDKFFFGLTYQRFQFDRQDDLDLRGFQIAIPVQIPPISSIPVRIEGLVNSQTSISLNIAETSAHFTYGVTQWLDTSFALPIVTSSITMRTEATFSDVSTGTALVTLPQTSLGGSSTGIGDTLVRVKAKALDLPAITLALATDVRVPTGDEFNYHGAGAYGVKPAFILSLVKNSISPHLNVGYQWNGKSFLASRSATQNGQLPGQLYYAAGVDSALSRRLTLSVDIIDQVIIHSQRALLFPAQTSTGAYSTVEVLNRSHHETNASAGFKALLGSNVLLTGNLLMRVNEAGLRARVVPTFGLSRIF